MKAEVLATGNEAWVPRDLFPFESRFLAIDGHTVHYLDVGSGPTLLLLHGNPTWSFLYRDVIRRLSHQSRCIAPDFPGFGLSRAAPGYDYRPQRHAELLERLVDRLGLEDITLVVQDWGGPVGLWVAGRHPERIRALVLGNTWAWPVNGDLHFEGFSRLMGGPIGRFAIRHFNAFVAAALLAWWDGEAADPAGPAGAERSRTSRNARIHARRSSMLR